MRRLTWRSIATEAPGNICRKSARIRCRWNSNLSLSSSSSSSSSSSPSTNDARQPSLLDQNAANGKMAQWHLQTIVRYGRKHIGSASWKPVCGDQLGPLRNLFCHTIFRQHSVAYMPGQWRRNEFERWGHQSGAKRRKKFFGRAPPLFGSKKYN